MTSWTVPARAEAVDSNNSSSSSNRDSTMFWEDVNSASTDDRANDFLYQFVDFDADANPNAFSGDVFSAVATTLPGMAESIMLMGDHHAIMDSNLSSGVSSGDEFDFHSCSSQVGVAASAASHDMNPNDVALRTDDLLLHGGPLEHYTSNQHHHHPHQPFGYIDRGSVSEVDISRLQDISLHSPHKPQLQQPASDPSSPTPSTTEVRKPKKFVEALSATLKKASKLRKSKKTPDATMQTGSPEPEQAQRLNVPKQRGRGKARAAGQENAGLSPSLMQKQQPQQQQQPQQPQQQQPQQQQQQQQQQPRQHHQQQEQEDARFVHGHYEDPFRDGNFYASQSLSLHYHGQVAPHTSDESPGVKLEAGHGQFQVDAARHQHHQSQHQHQHQHQQLHWTGAGGEHVTGQETGWWTPNLMSQDSNDYAPHRAPQPQLQRSATIHTMGHGPSVGMQFGFDPVPDTSDGGLMIHMPQPRGSQSSIVMNHDLIMNAPAFLPPPHHAMPQTVPPVMPASERSHRPPKAKSSGARHMSCSPVRKQRGPSGSPTPADRSRHSSGASASSGKGSSGRLPGSMPGTPCSVRKRRSRDVSGSSGGLSLGDSGVGFVNFTPNDGGVLMTGVAPSGSSKTKARREKEAQERRRRLSEAAIKAVAAAGGDVDKLLEQGFSL